MTDVINFSEYRAARAERGAAGAPVNSCTRVVHAAAPQLERGPYAHLTPAQPAGDQPASPRVLRKKRRPGPPSRGEVARVARALRAGLTAFTEAMCASMNRTMAYAAELEAWGADPRATIPASAARYLELVRASEPCDRPGCPTACAHVDPYPEMNARFWGEHLIESPVTELMRIVAGGRNAGEKPRDVLNAFDRGFSDSGLAGVVADAVEASLARDRAEARRRRAAAKTPVKTGSAIPAARAALKPASDDSERHEPTRDEP